MHQTFYIDIDEEITSIVDRLRKAKAKDIIIVVPKRALLIQSIVNLKLLKKESDNLGKEIAIVTQDKLGKLLVEKTGITVQQDLDDSEGEEMTPEDISNKTPIFDEEVFEDEKKIAIRSRLESMGSSEYFEEAPKNKKISIKKEISQKEETEELGSAIEVEEEKIINKELVIDIGEEIEKKIKKRKAPTFDIVKKANVDPEDERNLFGAESKTTEFKLKVNRKSAPIRKKTSSVYVEEKNPRDDEDEKIRNFFKNEDYMSKREAPKRKEYSDVNLSGKSWKYFKIIGLGGIAVIVLAVAYLFLPQANIKLLVKSNNQSMDAQVKGTVSATAVDSENRIIPARVILQNGEFTSNFEVTGNKSATNQKARGTITIYNEYSNKPQPLVATTRFQSPDGKIFRLIKTTTVPGTSVIAGETKPGAIEADVIADEAGAIYNIEATTFTIPGFKDSGNEKYTKFYAKSFKAMSGGGDSGTQAKSISATDIANAKNKAKEEINKSVKQKLKDSAGEGAVLLDDAIVLGEVVYEFSNSEGEMVNNFALVAKTKSSAIVFNEKDLREILEKDIDKNSSTKNNIDKKALVLQYGKADVDLTKGEIVIRVNVSTKVSPAIDLDNLKKGILGKSEDDFKAYLRDYSDIKGAEIDYYPSFISGKIPAYGSRVNIELDNN